MTQQSRQLVLEAVYERDVDLLLVEELHCSASFQQLVFEAAIGSDPDWSWTDGMEVTVRHSLDYVGDAQVTDDATGEVFPSSGETDIDVLFRVPGGSFPLLLLIENKIDAPFMPQQPERYRGRAAAKVRAGECGAARTVLIAPSRYIESTSAAQVFDARIPYELLVSYFEARGGEARDRELARRCEYRAELLEHAIHQYRRGGGPTVPHTGVRDFRTAYYIAVQQYAPTLRMQAPNPNGHWAGDAWIEFRHALQKHPGLRADIVHKLPRERVDLQLYGWAKHERVLRPALEALLDADMFVPFVNRGTKSLAVAIHVPHIDHQGSFDQQRDAAEAGMRAARRLQDWYQDNAAELRRLAASVAEEPA
jgi:hypothetical protein